MDSLAGKIWDTEAPSNHSTSMLQETLLLASVQVQQLRISTINVSVH